MGQKGVHGSFIRCGHGRIAIQISHGRDIGGCRGGGEGRECYIILVNDIRIDKGCYRQAE
jgi:hypothetical protein